MNLCEIHKSVCVEGGGESHTGWPLKVYVLFTLTFSGVYLKLSFLFVRFSNLELLEKSNCFLSFFFKVLHADVLKTL